MPVIIQNIVRFVLLVLVQVLVLDNVQFLGYINPYVYPLFILSLPVKTRRWLTLVLAFALGICVDTFSDTLGLHAFACVLVAFLRDPLLKLLAGTDDNADYTPSFATLGTGVYVKYVVILVLTHHLALYLLDTFSPARLGETVLRAVGGALVSLTLIFGIQLLKRR